MKKKSSQKPSSQDELGNLPNFTELSSRVFSVNGKGVFVGGEILTLQLRSLLRDEAKSLASTRLWEILNASVLNEAYNLALIQSTDFNQVQFAKALKHWSHFLMNVIHVLAKEN